MAICSATLPGVGSRIFLRCGAMDWQTARAQHWSMRLGERMRSLVSWSRLFVDQEVLVAVNTDELQPVTAYSTVAPTFRIEGDEFHLIFWYAPKHVAPPPSSLTVERKNGPLAVRMTLPPAGKRANWSRAVSSWRRRYWPGVSPRMD